MNTVQVTIPGRLTTPYAVQIGTGLLATPGWMPSVDGTVAIITDHLVKHYYAKSLQQVLLRHGHRTIVLSFKPGEASKTRRTKARLEDDLLQQGCGRDSLILALGGGVVGDLAGFVAATFMRGIPYLQLPTTLLAMIDSAVGGKTGIDTPHGKNLLGAYWQPQAVIADLSCLQTLAKTHLVNGLIEAIKIFLTHDQQGLIDVTDHLDHLLCDPSSPSHAALVSRAVALKAIIVQRDEQAQGERAVLNFGHTIGHALEHVTRYQLCHGEAVAIGMLVEAKLAQQLGFLSTAAYGLIEQLITRLGITTRLVRQLDSEAIIHATQYDKKRCAGQARYVLLNGLGSVYQHQSQWTHPVSAAQVRRAWFASIGR